MPRMRAWGPIPDAPASSGRGFPFVAARSAGAPVAAMAGLEAERDRLMAERGRLLSEIEYIDKQSVPQARETALNAVILAESRGTDMAYERAKALAGKVESMAAARAELAGRLEDLKARLCGALLRLSDAKGRRP